MRLDPRIGTLNTGKFYAYPNDAYDKPPVIGTLEQVETALGLRQPAQAKKQKSQNQWRDYIVTVTPQFKVYCGDWSNGEYTTTVYARSHAEAIKKEREEYNDREGRGPDGVPAKFKARLAK